jgi:NAD-dependent deacetylase
MRTIVVFSGAGLSQESGIPTFRDSNGLWENHKVEDVASPEGWERDPQLVLNFYNERFNQMKSVEPNNAHKALARLEEKFRVVHFTQNVDDLLERAGCKEVNHFHGLISRQKCEWHREITVLQGDIRFQCDYKSERTGAITLNDQCPKCGGKMRPDVVWFEEAVDFGEQHIKELAKEVKYNDGVFICVGTSGQVVPAALLISFFSQVPHKYIVDMKPSKIADYTLLKGKAGEQMTRLADALLAGERLESNVPDSTPEDIRVMLADIKSQLQINLADMD